MSIQYSFDTIDFSNKDEVIVIKCANYEPDEVKELFHYISTTFPKKKCILIPSDWSIYSQDKVQLIKQLENLIAYLKEE